MKTIELAQSAPSLQEILAIARKETLLLRTESGEEFFLGMADELRSEATLLSQNPEFMRFLDTNPTQLQSQKGMQKSLEEDLEKERFFSFARRTYWAASEASPARDLMQTLIGRLDF